MECSRQKREAGPELAPTQVCKARTRSRRSLPPNASRQSSIPALAAPSNQRACSIRFGNRRRSSASERCACAGPCEHFRNRNLHPDSRGGADRRGQLAAEKREGECGPLRRSSRNGRPCGCSCVAVPSEETSRRSQWRRGRCIAWGGPSMLCSVECHPTCAWNPVRNVPQQYLKGQGRRRFATATGVCAGTQGRLTVDGCWAAAGRRWGGV
jgi:hypothetical protein